MPISNGLSGTFTLLSIGKLYWKYKLHIGGSIFILGDTVIDSKSKCLIWQANPIVVTFGE